MRLLISVSCEGVWECGVEAHSPSNAAVCFATGRSDSKEPLITHTHTHLRIRKACVLFGDKEQQDVCKVRRSYACPCVSFPFSQLLLYSEDCLPFSIMVSICLSAGGFMNDQWLKGCSRRDCTGEVWESHSVAWFAFCHISVLRLAATVVMPENLFRPLCLTPALFLTSRFIVFLMWL